MSLRKKKHLLNIIEDAIKSIDERLEKDLDQLPITNRKDQRDWQNTVNILNKTYEDNVKEFKRIYVDDEILELFGETKYMNITSFSQLKLLYRKLQVCVELDLKELEDSSGCIDDLPTKEEFVELQTMIEEAIKNMGDANQKLKKRVKALEDWKDEVDFKPADNK